MTGETLVEAARLYLGVPWVHAGRSRLGLDCVGLPLLVAHDLGITDFEDVNYSRVVNPERLRRQIEVFCDPVPVESMQPGDVLLFDILGTPQHVGLYAGDGRLIHAYETAACVVEHRLDKSWRRRIVQTYRLRNLDG